MYLTKGGQISRYKHEYRHMAKKKKKYKQERSMPVKINTRALAYTHVLNPRHTRAQEINASVRLLASTTLKTITCLCFITPAWSYFLLRGSRNSKPHTTIIDALITSSQPSISAVIPRCSRGKRQAEQRVKWLYKTFIPAVLTCGRSSCWLLRNY